MKYCFYFSGDPFQVGGGATVAKNILSKTANAVTDIKPLLVVSTRADLPVEIEKGFEVHRWSMPKNRILLELFDQVIAPLRLLFLRLDRVICLNSIVPILYPKRVDVFYQMRMFYFEDIDTLSKKIKNILGKMSLRRAKSVYVASQDHRRDLLKNLKISSEKIKVVHLAVNHRTLNQNSTSTDKRSNDFLFVSVIRPYKNLHSLVEAFGRLYRESPKKCPNLNIIGKPANYKNIEEYMQGIDDVIKEYGVGHKVFFLGAKTFDECMEYMSKCRAFIFPTLFEGFGLPLLEAMATHTPVLTSDKNSLPEIGGNTVMYMNAENVESIKNAMLDVIDNGYSQKLIENAFNRSKEFQWFKTASAIIKDVEYKV